MHPYTYWRDWYLTLLGLVHFIPLSLYVLLLMLPSIPPLLHTIINKVHFNQYTLFYAYPLSSIQHSLGIKSSIFRVNNKINASLTVTPFKIISYFMLLSINFTFPPFNHHHLTLVYIHLHLSLQSNKGAGGEPEIYVCGRTSFTCYLYAARPSG